MAAAAEQVFGRLAQHELELEMENGLMALAIFGSIAVICVGCTIAVQWRLAFVAKVEADLKREMIQRGMSPGEIVQVLKASKE